MAKHMSNMALGQFLFRNDTNDGAGSNLRVLREYNTVANPLGFATLATVESYSTPVATLVQNTYTGFRELWANPHRYSNTTERHMRYILAGAHAYQRDVQPGFKIYWPQQCPRYHRDNIRMAATVADKDLRLVVQPRLRDATRKAAVTRAIGGLKSAVAQVTEGTDAAAFLAFAPETIADVGKARELTRTLESWQHLTVPELRTVVSGYLELEREGC